MRFMDIVCRSPEMLCQMQLHIKPRHLFKLLLTCKTVHGILDGHEKYWERVALHLLWKYNVEKKYDIHLRFTSMVNLREGYYRGMNIFLEYCNRSVRDAKLKCPPDVREKLSSDKDRDYDGDYCCKGRYTCREIMNLGMKDIVKREVEGIILR